MSTAHIARIIERLDPADRAALEQHLADIAWSPQTAWAPEYCPITGLKLFMWIEHPTECMVPTYGGPFDSYTIPVKDSGGNYCRQRYDHDRGGWLIDECEDVGVQVVSDQLWVSDGEDPADLKAERDEHLDHLKQICEIVGEVENGKHDIGAAWESVAAIKHQRDELAEKNETLSFSLVDSVKLAAVVAYPETHKDCDWKPMAMAHMKKTQNLVTSITERDDQIRLDAINHFANMFSEAVESGFVEMDEKLAADFEGLIRQHGKDNYHPEGIIKKMGSEATCNN